jgi:hypothetical protein
LLKSDGIGRPLVNVLFLNGTRQDRLHPLCVASAKYHTREGVSGVDIATLTLTREAEPGELGLPSPGLARY